MPVFVIIREVDAVTPCSLMLDSFSVTAHGDHAFTAHQGVDCRVLEAHGIRACWQLFI